MTRDFDGETIWTASRSVVTELFGASVIPVGVLLVLLALCFV